VLVRFDSKAGTLTTFGDVAVKLLRLMGQSGSVPGAILAQDIPAALARLRQGVGQEPPTRPQSNADDNDPPVNLSQRAFPLIELRPVCDLGELRIAIPQQTRDRHAVQHAAFRCLRRMSVHVRIDPQKADESAIPQRVRDTFPCADRGGVIAAEDDGHLTFAHDRFHAPG
jgi:hypothetical protein